ncbi:unnamed protein product [Meloidogyne enterolobii]|uniref:Uncharacterized protein n=1 Tax=Meloidogyne enterolobii TaxID=390850 RepID=A0ACB1A133_MELEN
MKVMEPVCAPLAVAVVNFSTSLCRVVKSVAVAGANEGCSTSIAELSAASQRGCHEALGVSNVKKLIWYLNFFAFITYNFILVYKKYT